jgi:hypothetical protein
VKVLGLKVLGQHFGESVGKKIVKKLTKKFFQKGIDIFEICDII